MVIININPLVDPELYDKNNCIKVIIENSTALHE